MSLHALSLVCASLLATHATDPTPSQAPAAACSTDEVPWNGGCFHTYEWRTDPKSCPEGVILIPEGEKLPRCTPCDYDVVTKQQPMNYCAGLRFLAADRELDRTFAALLKEFPAQAHDVEKAEAAWIAWRDAECAAERSPYAEGSMAPLVYEECRREKTLDRIGQLKRLRDAWKSR